MSRTPLVIGLVALALALLTVGAAGHTTPAAVDGGATQDLRGEQPARVVDVPNTTNYLFPNSDSLERQTYVRANVDVGSAVATSAARLAGEHRSRTFDNRLTTRSSDAAELAVVEQAVSAAEQEMARLNASQRSLFRAYNNGTLSRQQFLRGLVRLDVRITEHQQFLTHLRVSAESRLDGSLPSSLDTRISSLQSHSVALPNPLTDRIQRAVLGNADSMMVYTGGADDAVVLASVDDGQFYRQATLPSEHRPGEPDQFEQGEQQAIVEVVERATELYPWAYSNDQQFSRRIESVGPTTSIYRIEAGHPQGSLSSYISGSTTNAFHEMQTLDPGTVPVYRTVTNETTTHNLTVTTTTETGPMHVELSTSAGIPQNGTVFVDGQRISTTGSDGSLWTVRPAGTFELVVVGENGTRVSLEPVRFLRTS